jgi:hypothetical protein
VSGKQVEVQIRTQLQHLWARLSEGWASTFDQSIKYGGGLPEMREILESRSKEIAEIEAHEQQLLTAETEIWEGIISFIDNDDVLTAAAWLSSRNAAFDDLARFKQDVEEWHKREILKAEELQRTRHDLPDRV